MSDRSMLDRYLGRQPADGPTTPVGEDVADEAETLGCFGLLRGSRERAVALELRRRSGEVLAVPYGYVARLEYTPQGGILLCCGSETVRIRGRNLNHEVRPRVTLFGGLARQAVTWVCEADRSLDLAGGGDAVLIEAIEW